jgi:hypothetical protein
MAWEYLENFDYRYDIVSRYINDDDFVVEFNSGNSRLRDYVKNHVCNDLYYKEADYQIPDHEFKDKIEKCDVLVCLGVGGYEISGEELESKTITQSIIETTNKFKPRLLIVENVERFKSIIDRILKETNYEVERVHTTEPHENWVFNRSIFICKTQSIENTKN